MKQMLIKTLQRVCDKGGEPVIQLKTAFGGGKTHSMLALYHLMRSEKSENLPNIKPVLEEAKITAKPKVVTAVLVGTFLDPAKQNEYPQLPGIKINTLLGEMTAQLAIASGNVKLYDLIKENDTKGIAPGSKTLTRILDTCGPCIILIDELVVYAGIFMGTNRVKYGPEHLKTYYPLSRNLRRLPRQAKTVCLSHPFPNRTSKRVAMTD
jgi:predicted AAA+ superfamily ATPase